MKSCKIFTSALIISLTATGAFGMQKHAHPSDRQTRQAAAQPKVAQPLVIGTGNRVASIHNTSPTSPIYFKAIVDWQESPAMVTQISTSMPVVIRFNQDLALALAVQSDNNPVNTNRNLAKTLLFGSDDLPGKTILLNVCHHYGSNGLELLIQPDALCGGIPRIYAKMDVNGVSSATNITQDEINAQLAIAEQILWQLDNLIKAKEEQAASAAALAQAATTAPATTPATAPIVQNPQPTAAPAQVAQQLTGAQPQKPASPPYCVIL